MGDGEEAAAGIFWPKAAAAAAVEGGEGVGSDNPHESRGVGGFLGANYVARAVMPSITRRPSATFADACSQSKTARYAVTRRNGHKPAPTVLLERKEAMSLRRFCGALLSKPPICTSESARKCGTNLDESGRRLRR